MAWGEKRGGRAPGEYGLFDKIGLGFASAVGIAVATVVNLTQTDGASALFKFNDWLTSVTAMLGIASVPLYGVILILMAIGAGSVTYFQPVTARGAFAQGFGLLAVLTTIAPSDHGNALPGMDNDLPAANFIDDLPPAGDGGSSMDMEGTPDGIVFRPGIDSVTAQRITGTAARTTGTVQSGYNLRIKIAFPQGLNNDVSTMVRRGTLRGRLVNKTSGVTYNLFANSGAELDYRGNALYIATTLPGSAPTASLALRVEADGYAINDSRYTARPGSNPVWSVRMEPSGRPLILQRLNRAPL